MNDETARQSRFAAGTIVRSTAGHDAGRIYLVLRGDETRIWLTDGRLKPLANPKPKNPLHLRPTGTTMPIPDPADEEGARNAAVRIVLRSLEKAYRKTRHDWSTHPIMPDGPNRPDHLTDTPPELDDPAAVAEAPPDRQR